VSVTREYADLMNHLRDARAALGRAEQALDLIGPADLGQYTALPDLIGGIQTSADLIGKRTEATWQARQEYRQATGRVPDRERDDLPDSALPAAADYVRDVAAELEQREAGQ
jgi:hypothetical protein